MSKETARILRKAKKRLAGRWAQGAFARTPAGRLLNEYTGDPGFTPDSCRVCALGAVRWAAWGDPLHPYMSEAGMRAFLDARSALTAALPPTSHSVEGFNDWNRRTEGDVLALFDRAIAAEVAG